MNLQQAAQMALDVQCACNLSGVVRSFARVMDAIPPGSTDERNKHPIAILFATQIAYLSGVAVVVDSSCDYNAAYKACMDLANQPTTQEVASC